MSEQVPTLVVREIEGAYCMGFGVYAEPGVMPLSLTEMYVSSAAILP